MSDSDQVGSASPDDSNSIDAMSEALSSLLRIDPTDRWVEVLAATILALATIASAWSAYQATTWNGVQAEAYAEAGALRAESVRASDLADAELTIDAEYFAIWLDAIATDNDELRQLIEDQFRPEFLTAFDAWISLDPLGNPDAPHSPFGMPEYRLAATEEAEDLREQAEAATAEAIEANQTGDNYVLTTVLFASVLFFAGISTKFHHKGIKLGLLLLGLAAFGFGAALLISFPMN